MVGLVVIVGVFLFVNLMMVILGLVSVVFLLLELMIVSEVLL